MLRHERAPARLLVRAPAPISTEPSITVGLIHRPHTNNKTPLNSAGSGSVLKRDTGVPPVNHAQDARATIKLTHYDSAARIDTFINRIRIRATRASLA